MSKIKSESEFRAAFIRATDGITARDLCELIECNRTEVYEWRAGTRAPGSLIKWAPRLDALLSRFPKRAAEIRALADALRVCNIPDERTDSALRRHFFGAAH